MITIYQTWPTPRLLAPVYDPGESPKSSGLPSARRVSWWVHSDISSPINRFGNIWDNVYFV